MTIILGLSSGPHDSGACLFKDGALQCAANEERFSRKKQDGRFPSSAIAFCLQTAGLQPADIDVVAHGWRFLMDGAAACRVAAEVAS
eukprot:5889523-Amphidinium_carterae.1